MDSLIKEAKKFRVFSVAGIIILGVIAFLLQVIFKDPEPLMGDIAVNLMFTVYFTVAMVVYSIRKECFPYHTEFWDWLSIGGFFLFAFCVFAPFEGFCVAIHSLNKINAIFAIIPIIMLVLMILNRIVHKKESKLESAEIKSTKVDDKMAECETKSQAVFGGKYWDMKTFTATPGNVEQLEKDAQKLLETVQDMYDSKEIVDNWLCHNRMQLFTAQLSGNKELENALSTGFNEMGKSGSWKLKTLQFVMLSMDLALLSAGLGGDNPLSFTDLTDRSDDYRAPQTDDEEEFYNAAMLGSIAINRATERVIKQM